MTFSRPPAGDDPQWPRASAWLDGTHALAPDDAPLLQVLGAPCSVGSISPSEAWRTPPLVRQALARLAPYDPVTDTDLRHALRVADHGDLDIADLPLVPALDAIERRTAELATAEPDAVTVVLGGDNAVTRPVVTGHHGPDLSRVGVITLDAHHDVRHLDDGPRNGTPIRGLVEDGLDPRHVVQVGIARFTNSPAHAAWCAERGISVLTIDEVHRHGVEWAVEQALTLVGDVDWVHLDVDVDVLDAAFAPACPGARPGGFTPDQLLRAVELLARDERVASVDLVEVDPTSDVEGRTVMATAMALLAFGVGLANR